MMYLWHDGCAPRLVPDIGYRGLSRAVQEFSIIRDLELPQLSNAEGKLEPGSLFPVLDMDKIALAVVTTRESRERESPLFFLDFEMAQLTLPAHSVSAFIAHLLRALEACNFEVTRHGLTWSPDPLRLSPTMTPIG